jgi:beta-lactamase regulating signal transducer with metallopeptidase domain
MTFFLAVVVDVTVILAVALLLTLALRRHSAALRHLVLACALLGTLLIPALELIGPQWSLPLLPWQGLADVQSSGLRLVSTPAAAPSIETPADAVPPAATNWLALVIAAWVFGAVAGFAGLITGLVRVRGLTKRCTRVTRGRWRDLADELGQTYDLRHVTVLQSAEPSLLVTCGMVRPKIVLPAGAESWTDERRRVVLAHELEHIRRGDWAMHVVAEALRAAYWFHPLVWLACRRLRQESEYACDDAVLARGVEPTEYATHLLDVARHAVRQREFLASAPAIAHPSTLERRIAAMLNQQRSRQPLTRSAAGITIALTLAVAIPLTAATVPEGTAPAPAVVAADRPLVAVEAPEPTPALATAAAEGPASTAGRPAAAAAAQEKPASIKGTLYDQLGGVLPGVMVTLTDRSVGASYSTTSSRTGTFVFQELQPATYELSAQLPGFMNISNVMPIGAGSNIERHITMPIGSVEETLRAVCEASGSTPSPRPRRVINEASRAAAAPQPVGAAPFSGGVGGQIKAPRKTRSENPLCPNGGPAVNTDVILSARIGIDGYVSDVRLADRPNSRPAPEFVESALDAVSLWQFTPTLLNGVPVEVPMTILISYTWK